MKLDEIKELMKAMEENNLSSFIYNEGSVRLELRRGAAGNMQETAEGAQQPAVYTAKEGQSSKLQTEQGASGQTASEADKKAAPEALAKEEGRVIHSPLVGTFYAASAPDKAPFVQVGDHVKKGQVLGLIEAMKLMNEIESECDGVIAEILIGNEAVVEYGQPLFRIV